MIDVFSQAVSSPLVKYFPLFAALTPLVLFFKQTQSFFLRIFGILWKKRFVSRSFSTFFYAELRKNSIPLNFDDYQIESYDLYSKTYGRYLYVPLKSFNMEIFLYKNFIPVVVFGGPSEGIKIQYLKYTFPFEKFMQRSQDSFHQETLNLKVQKSYFNVTTYRGKSLKSVKSSNSLKQEGSSLSDSKEEKSFYGTVPSYVIVTDQIPNRTFGLDIKDFLHVAPFEPQKDKYQFTPQGKYVLSQVEKWYAAESWYLERNIRWYRSMILHSAAGTGKSQLVLEIAKRLHLPIFIFDITSMDNEEFCKAIEDMGAQAAIVLFEDLDVIWNRRQSNVKTENFGGLTFDCFINKLSGVDAIKNKFVFVTTNHLEALDGALTRAGRCGDEIIELQSLDTEAKKNLAKIYVGDNEEILNKLIKTGESMTTAEFESLCMKEALDKFWKEKC